MKVKVGTRIEIVQAKGHTIGKGKIPLKDPHPEYIGKEGTITSIDSDGMPHIRLDNGIELLGCDCWWQEVSNVK